MRPLLSLKRHEWIALLVGGIWNVSCGVVSCYMFHTLWMHRHKYYIIGRYAPKEIVGFAVSMVGFAVSRPLWLYRAFLWNGSRSTKYTLGHGLILFIGTVLTVGSITGIALLPSVRIWHQYYSAQLAVKVTMAEWRSVIDESLVTEEMSWFIRNKDTYGNRSYVGKIALFVWVIIMMIGLSLSFVTGVTELPVYLAIATLFSCMMGVCYLGYRYPPFGDSIELKKEKIWISRMGFVLIIGYALFMIIPRILGYNWNDTPRLITFFTTAQQMYSIGCLVGFTLIMTNFVIVEFEEPTRSLDCCDQFEIPLCFDNDEDSMNEPYFRASSVESQSPSSSPRNTDTLRKVLANNTAFRAFMSHLVTEFSYENALCFIECSKFREKVRELDGETDETDPNGMLGRKYEFCSDIQNAKSTLVSRISSKQDIKAVFNDLCLRYMDDDGPFAVNVSYLLRMALLQAANDPLIQLDCRVFDLCLQECVKLMKDSLSRFDVESLNLE